MERRRLTTFLPGQEDCTAFQNFVIEAVSGLEIMLLAKLLGKRNRVILRDEDWAFFQWVHSFLIERAGLQYTLMRGAIAEGTACRSSSVVRCQDKGPGLSPILESDFLRRFP